MDLAHIYEVIEQLRHQLTQIQLQQQTQQQATIDHLQQQINQLEQRITALSRQLNHKEPCQLVYYYTDNANVNNINNVSTYQLVIDESFLGNHSNHPKWLWITAVAGGGAGGLGFVDGIYTVNGGGGGAGEFIIDYPIPIKLGYRIVITVGQGGDWTSSHNPGHGQPTTITVYHQCHRIFYLSLSGGHPGHPTLEEYYTKEKICTGGAGGHSSLIKLLWGQKGTDGGIHLPSQAPTTCGTGGHALQAQGGTGGATWFAPGGTVGTYLYTDINAYIGQSGLYGSGGGGNLLVSISDDIKTVLSQVSKGGHGLVIIKKGC